MLLMSEAGAVMVTVTFRPVLPLPACRRRLEEGDGEAGLLMSLTATVTDTPGARAGAEAGDLGAVETAPSASCTSK